MTEKDVNALMASEARIQQEGVRGFTADEAAEFFASIPPVSRGEGSLAPLGGAWLDNVNDPHAPDSTEAYVRTIRSLHFDLRVDVRSNFRNIDAALEYVQLDRMNPFHIVLVLRNLFPLRGTLSNWASLQQAVRGKLIVRFGGQMNIATMMQGLNREEPDASQLRKIHE